MKMSERNIDKLMSDFLNGDSSEEDLQKLRKWIEAADENCRRFNRALNQWHGMHPTFTPREIDIDAEDKRMIVEIGKTLLKRTAVYWQRIASIIVVPLMLYSLYAATRTNASGETEYQEVAVPYGVRSKLNLPDGSLVWLNGGSSLKYPVRFVGAERETKLNGEGFFEVKADEKSTFVVTAGEMRLKAVGTSFNVESREADSTIAVTMIDGKIDVAFAGREPTPMTAGDRAVYSLDSGKCRMFRIGDANDELYKWYSWKDGVMILCDEPLKTAFKRLAQSYNVEFVVEDNEIAETSCRATFRCESLDEIMRLLEMTAPIQFEYSDKIISENFQKKQKIEVRRKKQE